MDKIIGVITILIMISIVIIGMFPAMLSNDPVKVQQAADTTIERILEFSTDRIVDEVKGLPLKIVTDELSK